MTDHLEYDAGALVDFNRLARDIRDRRARQPGRSVLFADLGDARTRRQIVRWLGREYRETTPGIIETLRSALGDADWEVRASAILVCARLGAASLRSAVLETPLPSAHQHGLSEHDTRLLVAARVIAAESLSFAAHGDTDRATRLLDRLPGAPRDLVHGVLGLAVSQLDDDWLMLHALSSPHELADPLPESLPNGLTRNERHVRLSSVIDMCWVSPLAHLIGSSLNSELHGGPLDVREYTPSHGFFISRRPLSYKTVTELGLESAPSWHAGASIAAHFPDSADASLVMPYDEALALCELVSARSGAIAALPTADELECAARGTDGRRYPWGNGLERLPDADRSPHGVERFAFPAAQWTSTHNGSGAQIAMGGPAVPRCSERKGTLAPSAIRIVVRQLRPPNPPARTETKPSAILFGNE